MNRRQIEISLGLLVLAALTILAFAALKMGRLKGLGQSLQATVVFDNAAGLVEGASVKVAGVQVGRVSSLDVDFDKAKALLLLDKNAEIRTDALAAVRARSLLGEKYVELTPRSRTAPLLADGGSLSSSAASLELDQVVSELGPLIKELDAPALNTLLKELSGVVTDNRAAVASVVHRTDNLLARLEKLELDDPAVQAEVKTIIHQLRLTSEGLPGLVKRTDESVARLTQKAEPLLTRLDQSLTRLEPALEQLPGTVEQLDTTLTSVERLMGRLEPMLERAQTIDYEMMRKLLREEGLLVRFKQSEVTWAGEQLQFPAPTPRPASGNKASSGSKSPSVSGEAGGSAPH